MSWVTPTTGTVLIVMDCGIPRDHPSVAELRQKLGPGALVLLDETEIVS